MNSTKTKFSGDNKHLKMSDDIPVPKDYDSLMKLIKNPIGPGNSPYDRAVRDGLEELQDK